MPAMLAWGSDWHLAFGGIPIWDQLNDLKADHLLLTGDIGPGTSGFLERIADSFDGPVYFVLGNHDYYGSSFEATDLAVAEVCRRNPSLIWLDRSEPVQIADGIWLAGRSGWACGRAGSGRATRATINDNYQIQDFRRLERQEVLLAMGQRAMNEAEAAFDTLARIPGDAVHILFATHVPPFTQSSLHCGGDGDPELRPYFVNTFMGECLRRAVEMRPGTPVTILCGHSHSRAFYREDSIQVVAPDAEYGLPRIAGLFQEAFFRAPATEREEMLRVHFDPRHASLR